jgi:hypothetical protein
MGTPNLVLGLSGGKITKFSVKFALFLEKENEGKWLPLRTNLISLS